MMSFDEIKRNLPNLLLNFFSPHVSFHVLTFLGGLYAIIWNTPQKRATGYIHLRVLRQCVCVYFGSCVESVSS
jgi:hypothetical protein